MDGENVKHPFEAPVVEEGVSLGAFGILPVAAQVALWDTEEGVEQKDGRPGPVTSGSAVDEGGVGPLVEQRAEDLRKGLPPFGVVEAGVGEGWDVPPDDVRSEWRAGHAVTLRVAAQVDVRADAERVREKRAGGGRQREIPLAAPGVDVVQFARAVEAAIADAPTVLRLPPAAVADVLDVGERVRA